MRTNVPARQTLTSSASTAQELLVCFSHLRWSFVYQRPQHLISRAARTRSVLFFEEPEYVSVEAPRVRVRQTGNVTRLWAELPEGSSQEVANCFQRAMLDSVLASRPERLLTAWYYTPLALRFSNPGAFDRVVYDCMDELSAFQDADPDLAACEHVLLKTADVVFAGGRSLYAAKRGIRADLVLEPSSVDAQHFRLARSSGLASPPDQAELPRPRVGWFGVIDERMDLELVAELAQLRPAWSFVMLGPVVKIDPASLPQAPNLHWLGGRRYAELPAYLGGWDVGFMPFACNAATRFISPTKTLEYLAAGVPLASTPVPDVVAEYGEPGVVEIAADAPAMAAACERQLLRAKNPWLVQVDALLARQSWDAVWRRMEAALDGADGAATRNVAG